MKITFVSNYINHHQIPFSEALYQKLGGGYCFIQTMPMEKERVAMGWEVDTEKIPYVRRLYDDESACRRIIAESDVVRDCTGKDSGKRFPPEGFVQNTKNISDIGNKMSACFVPALIPHQTFI